MNRYDVFVWAVVIVCLILAFASSTLGALLIAMVIHG